MYEQHFGFSALPFSGTPVNGPFFASESSEELILRVRHVMQSASGIVVITGPDGVGKTALLHHIRSLLARQGQAIVLPGTSLNSTDELYVGIRRGLRTLEGHPVPGSSDRWDVVNHLQKCVEFWGPIALLIDDAHLLDGELFMELQFLLEQRSDVHPLCRVLLAGALSLEETLARPAVAGLARRIRFLTFLAPLKMSESVEYLRSRLADAGSDLTRCFTAEAVEAVVEAAAGNVRCLNVLADESLMLACRQNEQQVTRDTVIAALDSLKDLPQSWNLSIADARDDALTESASAAPSPWQSCSDGVIEIGAPAPGAVLSPKENDAATDRLSNDRENCREMPDGVGADIPNPDAEQSEEAASRDVSEQTTDAQPAQIDPANHSEWSADRPTDVLDDIDAEEFEDVGEPSVEIDVELDRRLQRLSEERVSAATAASEAGGDEAGPDSTNVRSDEQAVWQPAGCWEARPRSCRDTIRRWFSEPAADAPGSDASLSTDGIGRYAICIPAPEDPDPQWPPSTEHLAPSASIDVAEQFSEADELAESAGEEAGCPSESEHPVVDVTESVTWKAGQLLVPSAETASLCHLPNVPGTPSAALTESAAAEECRPVLKIADVSEGGTEAGTSESGDVMAATVRDRLFTLPVSVDDIAGDVTAIADSVQEIQRDLEPLRRKAADRSVLHAPVPQTHQRRRNSRDSVSPPGESPVSLHSASGLSTPSHRPPHCGQPLTMLPGTGAVKAAAGAECCPVPVDQRPALSVAACDEEAAWQAEESGGSDNGESVIRFRDLFTRFRRQQRA